MRWISVLWSAALVAAMSGVVVAGRPASDRPFGVKPLLPFEAVEKAVVRHFERLPGYRPGEIISRSQAAPLFAQLRWMGWTVVDAKSLVERVPPDSDFLVRQLRTPSGRRFMQRVADSPGSYDELERLSRLPNGRRAVVELIARPEKGGDVIRYFATTPKGRRVGRLMARTGKGGADYDKPTGRIYTVEMLLDELEARYPKPNRRPAKSGTRSH